MTSLNLASPVEHGDRVSLTQLLGQLHENVMQILSIQQPGTQWIQDSLRGALTSVGWTEDWRVQFFDTHYLMRITFHA